MFVFNRLRCAGFLAILIVLADGSNLPAELQVGTAKVDIGPETFPVLVNGGMTSREASEVTGPMNARAMVVSDGNKQIAIVVVDSCMVPRPLLDDAKELAHRKTGIPTAHMLVSATHTHTAPAAMACLGTEVDNTYTPLLRDRIASSIELASKNLQPAKVGWGVIDAADFTAVRRWIYRSDRVQTDPFGNPTVRANMHAGRNWDNVSGPSAEEDPDLTLMSFQSLDGKPLAVLANFSMHYFSGVKALNPDYFGLFCEGLSQRLTESAGTDPASCLTAMSHGCSGDIWRHDYLATSERSKAMTDVQAYADGLIDLAVNCYRGIEHKTVSDIAMQETRMELKYRTPNVQLLEWSQRIAEQVGDRLPQTTEEVYALEQIILHERQSTEIVIQALRIGDMAIATTPNETYAITGYKVKLQSPLEKTMVIELANGGDGYIPPPEQHLLGGYNTWVARSAGLEVQAEPKIVQGLLALLEGVTDKPRQKYDLPTGSATSTILELKPLAYYRLHELKGNRAIDATENRLDGIYEPGVAYFMEGPRSAAFTASQVNRAMHFTGGRIDSRLAKLGNEYTISMWLWNGFPLEGRGTCGWFWSRGNDFDGPGKTVQLGIEGTDRTPGTLLLTAGDDVTLSGETVLPRWKWQHVVLVRDGESVSVYLNGSKEPELSGTIPQAAQAMVDQFYFAGRPDRLSGFEGRLDEIAIFDRVLDESERQQLFIE